MAAAGGHHRCHFTPRMRLRVGQGGEAGFGIRLQMTAVGGHIKRPVRRRVIVGHPLEHVEGGDGPIGLAGQVQRKPERLV